MHPCGFEFPLPLAYFIDVDFFYVRFFAECARFLIIVAEFAHFSYDLCSFCVLLGSTPGRVGDFADAIFVVENGKSHHHSVAGA